MCGIAGLFLKTPAFERQLGALMARMLAEMTDRGPDSAGFAVYRSGAACPALSCLAPEGFDWNAAVDALGAAMETKPVLRKIRDHGFIEMRGDLLKARDFLIAGFPDINVLAAGDAIEIFKGVGNPAAIAANFDLAEKTGTHGLAHTRMATESAVTVSGSHPFSTGMDTCLLHNGSLSNHNLLREFLLAKGETLQTENDSEVAAAFIAWRLREGDTLKAALELAVKRLDGFFTFTIGTRDGFAVVRDPISCKPAIIAETKDWVAMASEFRAIAQLPEVETASIWEPEPSVVYSWDRANARAAA